MSDPQMATAFRSWSRMSPVSPRCMKACPPMATSTIGRLAVSFIDLLPGCAGRRELLALDPHARVEDVAQPVPQQVEAQDGHPDGNPRQQRDPGGLADVVAAVGNDVPP